MDWQEIMKEVLEITELQQEVVIKSQNQVIKEITARNKNYCNNPNFHIKSLNNAVLEQKITITPYQIMIIKKINELSLPANHNSIYINMPIKEPEAAKYVNNLKKQYELANNCLDLVMDIEKLSEIEYDPENGYENSEYAKRVKAGDKILQDLKNYFLSLTSKDYQNILIHEYKKYIGSLDTERKTNLLIETFTLSYNKNAFEYFNKEVLIQNMVLESHSNLRHLHTLSGLYDKFRQSLILAEIMTLTEMPLEEIYNNFKLINEKEVFKQLKK